VRLIESQHVQVFIRDQIPERGAENREVIWESENAALDGDDERRGDVDQEEQPLIEDQPRKLYLQILERQGNLRGKIAGSYRKTNLRLPAGGCGRTGCRLRAEFRNASRPARSHQLRFS
jgi:hypothetical protein